MRVINNVFNTQNFSIFNGINYQFWVVKIRTLFKSQELWDLVKSGFQELVDLEQAPKLTTAQRNELKEN